MRDAQQPPTASAHSHHSFLYLALLAADLRKLAWAGIPPSLRPMAWQLLLGYLPAPASRRAPTLARKRQEYADAVRLAFARGKAGLDGPIWHQISIDVPRTRPGVRLWQGAAAQRALERVLYVWAIRHPASGYVQGINDLVTPFFQVFLGSYIGTSLCQGMLLLPNLSLTPSIPALPEQTATRKTTTSPPCRPQSSKRLRPTASGACPNYSTASRTITSSPSPASNVR